MLGFSNVVNGLDSSIMHILDTSPYFIPIPFTEQFKRLPMHLGKLLANRRVLVMLHLTDWDSLVDKITLMYYVKYL